MVVVLKPGGDEDYIPIDVCTIDFQPKGNISSDERSLIIGYHYMRARDSHTELFVLHLSLLSFRFFC